MKNDYLIPLQNYEGVVKKVYKSEEGMRKIQSHFNELLESWPIPYELGFVSGKYGRTFAIKCGNLDTQPLILLHGLGVNSTNFSGLVKQLSENYCLYLLDFPGAAGFSVPSERLMNESEVAEWLNETVDKLDIGKFHLAGVSFGAWIATKYAIEYEHKLLTLHLIAPPALSGKADITLYQILKLMWLGMRLNYSNAEKLCKMLSAKGNEPKKETVQSIFLGLKYSRSYKTSGHKQSVEQCHKLTIPMQIVIGEFESLSDRKGLSNLFPNAKITVIDNSSHFVHEEQTNVCSNMLTQFISESEVSN